MSATQAAVAGAKAWTPAAGASLHWQAQHTAVALSYSHSVSGGGGLTGAVELDSASGSLQQQLTRNLSASVGGSYANNGVLSLVSLGGHSISRKRCAAAPNWAERKRAGRIYALASDL